MKRSIRGRGLTIASCMSLLVLSLSVEARNLELTVTPEQPGCGDAVVLRAHGHWPNGCWRTDKIDFFVEGPTFEFQIHATFILMNQCPASLIPYESEQTIGPFSAGTYVVVASEIVDSPRLDGESTSVLFEVTCCELLPEPATDLRLGKLRDTQQLRMTWFDAGHADDYVVYASGSPDGFFVNEVGSAKDGLGGAEISKPAETTYYLVAGRNTCGIGIKR